METLLTGNRPVGFDDIGQQAPFVFDTDQAQHAASMAIDLIQHKYERQLTEGVQQTRRSDGAEPTGRGPSSGQCSLCKEPSTLLPMPPTWRVIVGEVTASIARNTIEIPEIVVIPSREVNFWFEDFDLTGFDPIRFQPLPDKMLIRTLRDDTQRELAWQVTETGGNAG